MSISRAEKIYALNNYVFRTMIIFLIVSMKILISLAVGNFKLLSLFSNSS